VIRHVQQQVAAHHAQTNHSDFKLRLHCFFVFLILMRAAPLCMAKWSVLSLLIKYCGSSFEARTVYVLNLIADVILFLIVPRTRPASEFHAT
jgi:hypothetical protein